MEYFQEKWKAWRTKVGCDVNELPPTCWFRTQVRCGKQAKRLQPFVHPEGARSYLRRIRKELLATRVWESTQAYAQAKARALSVPKAAAVSKARAKAKAALVPDLVRPGDDVD